MVLYTYHPNFCLRHIGYDQVVANTSLYTSLSSHKASWENLEKLISYSETSQQLTQADIKSLFHPAWIHNARAGDNNTDRCLKVGGMIYIYVFLLENATFRIHIEILFWLEI